MSNIDWVSSGEIIQFFLRIGYSHLAEAYHRSFLSCFPGTATSPVFHACSKGGKRWGVRGMSRQGGRGVRTLTPSTDHLKSPILLVIR